MAADPTYGKKDGRGQHFAVPLSDWRKQRLLEWLCTVVPDRKPKFLGELAEEMGVTRRVLTKWKGEDKEFQEEWEKRYRRGIGSPERKQEILDTLFRTATDQDDPKHVAAAGKYLDYVDDAKPSKMEVTVNKEAAVLTDEQLAELITEKAQAEQANRVPSE
jgi:hypothetical protein